MEEKKKSNAGLIIFLIIIILGLAGYICYDKFFNKKEISKTEEKEVSKKCDCSSKSGGQKRTYRFFGYDDDKDPDMYTSLVLNSDGEYELYVNQCSFIEKTVGIYKETEDSIVLLGDKEITFPKLNNGNTLDFSKTGILKCNESSGTFSLDSYMLNYVPSNSDI